MRPGESPADPGASLDHRAAGTGDPPARDQWGPSTLVLLSFLDERDLAKFTFPDYQGERLIVWKNLLMAAERARKRGELLQATEHDLAQVAAAMRRSLRPLRDKGQIGIRVGKVLGRSKMAKQFRIEILGC